MRSISVRPGVAQPCSRLQGHPRRVLPRLFAREVRTTHVGQRTRLSARRDGSSCFQSRTRVGGPRSREAADRTEIGLLLPVARW